MTDATRLQSIVTKHRMLLKNEIFAITQRIMDLELTLYNHNRFQSSGGGAKDLLSPSPRLEDGSEDDGSQTPSVSAVKEKLIRLEKTKHLITAADDIIGYQDEIHAPVTVMSFEATNGVFNSTIGIILTFLVLAVEGFSGNVAYDSVTGWTTGAN